MLIVFIMSYLFAAVVGGILSLSAFYFWAVKSAQKEKRQTKNPTEVTPLAEPRKIGPNPFNS